MQQSTFILRIHEYPRNPSIKTKHWCFVLPSQQWHLQTWTGLHIDFKTNFTSLNNPNQLLMNQNLVVILCSHTKSNSRHDITTTPSFSFLFQSSEMPQHVKHCTVQCTLYHPRNAFKFINFLAQLHIVAQVYQN